MKEVSRWRSLGIAVAAGLITSAIAQGAQDVRATANAHPVTLVRPPVAPLSAMAQLGRRVFFDSSLSSSGRLACASCHSPQHAYGPPGASAAMYGGPALSRQGLRAVPSLMYLEREPNFSIGPDDAENEAVNLTRAATASRTAKRAKKTAVTTAQAANNLVPQGGLFWDGRVDTLQGQALVPMLNPLEMDGGSVGRIATKLRAAAYAPQFKVLFGERILSDPRMLVTEAMFAVGRFEFEDPSFHPYSSKFDAWLEGKAVLTPAEFRGYRLFNDVRAGDCAACHLDKPTPDGLPPLFTDHQYEALGVPRNQRLTANHNPNYHDLGVCGPVRLDLRKQQQFCGMFATPTLRNVALRHVFFHNGIYQSLREVLDFYAFRATQPQRVYPHARDGSVLLYDDLPHKYRANVDLLDPPFDRRPGERLPLTVRDEEEIISFLKTLTDGWR